MNNNIEGLLSEVAEMDCSHIILAGDFNYPDIDWSTWTTSKSQNHESQKCIDACSDTFLHQHVLEPTRYRHGQHQNVLDLILTNEEDMIQNIEYLPSIGISDHV